MRRLEVFGGRKLPSAMMRRILRARGMSEKSRRGKAGREAVPAGLLPVLPATKHAAWWVLGAVLLAVVLLRVRLLSMPLERDEGAFAYMAQLLLKGIPPYTEAYDFKPPGLYAIYAVFVGLFGASAEGVHLGLLFANVASIILLFLIAKALVGEGAALAASASFAFLSLGPSVLGFAAHATHFVVLAALGGILVLLIALENRRVSGLFWSGALFGLSFLMKQSGLFFIFFGFVILCHGLAAAAPWRVKPAAARIGVFVSGVLAPLVLSVLLLWRTDALAGFWFWNVVYANHYARSVPPADGVHELMASLPAVIGGYFLVWAMAGAGFVIACAYRPLRRGRVFLLLFAATSFGAICPGFHFREHYFVLLLPAVALLSAVTVRYLNDFASSAPWASARLAPAVLVVVAIGVGVCRRADYYFSASPTAISRAIYGTNPFPEAVVIGRKLQERTHPADRIAIFGSEPEIYFYARRWSASRFIFTYPMAEPHEFARVMQEEMINSVTVTRPKYLVLVNVDTSWSLGPHSDRRIFEWLKQYTRNHYEVDGLIQMVPTGASYWWDEQARARWQSGALGDSPFLVVYRRNGA